MEGYGKKYVSTEKKIPFKLDQYYSFLLHPSKSPFFSPQFLLLWIQKWLPRHVYLFLQCKINQLPFPTEPMRFLSESFEQRSSTRRPFCVCRAPGWRRAHAHTHTLGSVGAGLINDFITVEALNGLQGKGIPDEQWDQSCCMLNAMWKVFSPLDANTCCLSVSHCSHTLPTRQLFLHTASVKTTTAQTIISWCMLKTLIYFTRATSREEEVVI